MNKEEYEAERERGRRSLTKAAKMVAELLLDEDGVEWTTYHERVWAFASALAEIDDHSGKVVGYVNAMTDEQAADFGNGSVPFGQFRNRRIDDVPLAYLDWIARQVEFVLRLHAYLESPRVKKEMTDEPLRRRGEPV